MNPYTIKAQAGQRARVDIYGDIGPWGNDAGQFRRDVQALGNVPLDVHISSPGGNADAGVNMHTFLASLPDVHTYADAAVASAATLPYLAGKKRFMATGASLMVHNPWDMVAGDAEALRKAADGLEFAAARLAEIYAKATGKAVDVIRKMMAETTWIDAAQAIADGWATDLEPGSTAQANIPPGRYKGTPAHLLVPQAAAKTAPEAARRAFDKGVRQVEDGLGGDGLEPATVREARSLKAGDAPTEAKIRKAYRWWARNERFLDAEADTPADVAANLWGGASGRDWFRALYAELEADESADAAAKNFVDADKTGTGAKQTDTMKNLTAALAQAGLLASADVAEDAAVAQLIANLKARGDAQASITAERDAERAKVEKAQAAITALAKHAADSAVRAGQITDGVRAKWEAQLVADPAGTIDLLSGIAPKAHGANALNISGGSTEKAKTLTERCIEANAAKK